MIDRIAFKKLREYLNNCGAVLLSGPKFCGKTFLANLICKSVVNIKPKQFDTKTFAIASKYVLTGEHPRLIDEWQNFPPIWDVVRDACDEAPSGHKTGLFVLTGSSSPADRSEVSHSGAGRILRMKLATLTFAEILNYQEECTISIQSLFDNNELKVLPCSLTYDDINRMMYCGGWPFIIAENIESPRLIIDGYIESLANLNAHNYYDLRINNELLKKILISLARNIGTQLTKTTILKDLGGEDVISRPTLDKYMQMFYDVDLIFKLEAWAPTNLRSRYRLKTKPKIYLCDTSLFCSILNLKSHQDLFNDLNSTGFVFENQVIKDLIVYCDAINARVFYINDEEGHDIDAIIEMRDGRWAAIQIKLSIETALDAATKFDNNLRHYQLNKNFCEPVFKMVICNCESSMTLDNGVHIVPHALLRP